MNNEVFGYGRVSTIQQHLDRQTELFKRLEIPEKNILTEKLSGTLKNRPALDTLKNRLRKGDTVYIESYSRLGRSVKNLINEIEWFNDNGIRLISDKEKFDTESSSGQLMLNIMLAFSQFERDLIVERTQEGKRARGNNGGRKPVKAENINEALSLYDKRVPIKRICEITKMSQGTLRKYINQRRIEKEKHNITEEN